MLRAVRKGKRQPFIIPSGLKGPLAGMVPGIWNRTTKGSVELMNPFKGRRTSQKKIAWMKRTVSRVTSNRNLKRAWGSEIDFVLRRGF